MGRLGNLFATLLVTGIAIAVMVVIATVVFYITVFVVSTGSSLAGLDPNDDFIVLSSSLIVVAIILTGGLTPRISNDNESQPQPAEDEDPAYF